MNLRFLLKLILGLTAAGMALVVLLAFLATQPQFVRERIRDALAQVLAQETQREVQVGEVSGNLLTGLQVQDLAIGDKGGLRAGVVVAAQRVRLRYDLVAVLRGRLKAPASVREIALEQAYLRVERSATGKVNLQDLLRRRLPRRVPPAEKFQPVITFRDCMVDLVAQGVKGRTVSVRLVRVAGSARLAPVGPLRFALRAHGADGAFGTLSLEGLADSDEEYAIVRGRLTDLPLARWAFLAGPELPLGVSSGSASAQFQFWMVPRGGDTVGPVLAVSPPEGKASRVQPEYGFFADLRAAGVSLRLPAPVGGSAYVSEAHLRATPQGVEVTSLDGAWQGSQLRLSGWLYDLRHPRADLRVSADRVDLADLRRRLPAKMTQGLEGDLAGSGRLEAEAVGPVEHLTVRLSLALPDGAVVSTSEVGEIALGSLTLETRLWDTATPAAIATVSGESAQLETTAAWPLALPGVAPAPAVREAPELALRGVESVQAEALWADDTPIVRGKLAQASATLADTPLTINSADFDLAGHSLRLAQVEIGALGGHVSADGLLTLPSSSGEPLRAVVNGQAEGMNLAALPADLWPLSEPRPQGTASGDFALTWAGGTGEASARLQLREVAYEGYSADRVEALAVGKLRPGGDWELLLPLARVDLPAGQASAWGAAGRDAPLDFRLDLGDLDLARLPWEKEPLAGRAFGTLRLTGSWGEPELSGQMVVFGAGYQGYEAGAVLADFTARPRSLQPADLFPPAAGTLDAYASYDTAVAQVNLTATPPATGHGSPALAGQARLSGVRLGALRTFLGDRWPKALPELTGWGEAEATIRGTVAAPTGTGQVRLAQVRYDRFFINSARAPFVFETSPEDEGYLVVKGGTISAQGARLDFDAELRGPRAGWTLVAQGRGQDLQLERAAPLLPWPLPLAGRMSVPEVTVTASEQGVSGEGRLIADQVKVGDSQVTGLDTRFFINQGQLRLERTTLQMAGGDLQAELTYDLHQKSLEGDLEFARVDVSAGLRLIAPLAAATAGSEQEYARVLQQWRQWGVRSEGEVEGKVRLRGPLRGLIAETSLAVRRAAYEGKPLPDVRGSLAFDAAARSVRDLSAELQLGQALVTLSGEAKLDGPLSLFADASNVNLAAVREWLPGDLGLGGVAGVTVEAKGTTKSPVITASVDVLSASVRGVGFDLVSVPVVRIAQGGIDLDRIIFRRQERRILGSGHLPFAWRPLGIPRDQPINFTARLENTDLGFFPPVFEELTRFARSGAAASEPTVWTDLTATGTVNAEMRVVGTLAQPSLEGFLRLEEGAASTPRWKHPLTHLNADLTVHGSNGVNMVQVTNLAGRYDQTRFRLGGSAALADLRPEHLGENVYDLALTVQADSQPLWARQTLDALQGTVALTTSAGGQPIVRIEGLGGKLGAGTVQLEGTVGLKQFEFPALARNDFDLRLTFEDANLEYPGLVKGTLTGTLALTNPQAGAPAVAAGLLTFDRGWLGMTQWGGKAGPAELRGAGSEFPDFGLEAAVALGSDVSLKTPALVTPLMPTSQALVAQGTPQDPHVWGRIEARPSRGTLPGTSFNLRSFTLRHEIAPQPGERVPPKRLAVTGHYSGFAEQTLPNVIVEGESLGPVHLAMTIEGDLPHAPTVRVTAEPFLTQEQILALVGLEGFVPSGTTDLSELLSQRFVSVLATGFREALFEPIETQLKRHLGLEEFSVSFSFDQPLEVRLGKYLLKNFLVTYRYSLIGGRQEQWNLGISYDLPQRYRVTYGTSDTGEKQFRVTRQWAF